MRIFTGRWAQSIDTIRRRRLVALLFFLQVTSTCRSTATALGSGLEGLARRAPGGAWASCKDTARSAACRCLCPAFAQGLALPAPPPTALCPRLRWRCNRPLKKKGGSWFSGDQPGRSTSGGLLLAHDADKAAQWCVDRSDKEPGYKAHEGGTLATSTRQGSAGGTETRLRRQKPRRAGKGAKLKGKGQTAAKSGSLYSIAMQHVRSRNYVAARRMFKLLQDSFIDGAEGAEVPDGRVFLAWGKMEARLHNAWAMRKAFAKGLKLVPDNTHIPHAWAIEELKEGNVDVARKLFHYALERDPGDGLIYQSFALLEQQQGNIDQARALLEEGTRKDPTNVFLWSACGVFETRQGRLQEAANMFQQATVLGPKHCQSWQAYGVLLEKMGKTDEAAEKFDRALEIDPESVPTAQAYGLMEARRRNFDKARTLFSRGVSIDASHAPIFHAWARMEEGLGNYEKARELLNDGVASAPQSVALLKAWALMELRLGHIDGSNEWYVSQRMGSRKLSKVTERLEMLRLLMEQRSEDDLKLVMKWIEKQRNQQLETQVSRMISVGAALPADWEEGRHFAFGAGHTFKVGDLVVVRTPGAVAGDTRDGLEADADSRVSFGRVIAPPADDAGRVAGAGGDEKDGTVYVHVGTLKVDGPRQPSEEDRKRRQSATKMDAKTAGDRDRRTGTKLKVVRRGDSSGSRRIDSMVTAQLSDGEVGRLLLTRNELIEMQRNKLEEQASAGFSLHAQREGDRLRLQVLMERYGEDYNLINLPAWVREAQAEEEEEEEEEEEKLRKEALAAEAGGVALLEQWVQRRSDDDVMAFRKWFNDMYQRDPGVGMKMLDWKMPSMWDLPDQNGAPPPPVPTEWTRLKTAKPRTGDGEDDDVEELVGEGKLRGAESLLRRLLQQRTGVNRETIKLAEFCLTMSVVSACLVVGPSFVSEWVQGGPERDPTIPRPKTMLPSGVGGVDAYLIQTGMVRPE